MRPHATCLHAADDAEGVRFGEALHVLQPACSKAEPVRQSRAAGSTQPVPRHQRPKNRMWTPAFVKHQRPSAARQYPLAIAKEYGIILVCAVWYARPSSWGLSFLPDTNRPPVHFLAVGHLLRPDRGVRGSLLLAVLAGQLPCELLALSGHHLAERKLSVPQVTLHAGTHRAECVLTRQASAERGLRLCAFAPTPKPRRKGSRNDGSLTRTLLLASLRSPAYVASTYAVAGVNGLGVLALVHVHEHDPVALQYVQRVQGSVTM